MSRDPTSEYINGLFLRTHVSDLRSGIEIAHQPFSGTENEAMFVGINISGFGGIANAAKPSVMVGYETDYNDGSAEQSELHFNFAGPAQNFKRPWIATSQLSSGANQYKLAQTFTADSSAGLSFNTPTLYLGSTCTQIVCLENTGNFTISVANAQNLLFQTNANDRWYIGGSDGNWKAAGDFAVLAGNGTSGAPSLSFINASTKGFYKTAGGDIGVTGIMDIQGTDAPGASGGTLTNAPSAGNPARWIPIKFNGTTYKVPAWT